MSSERIRILEMLEQGAISASEAAALLDALGDDDGGPSEVNASVEEAAPAAPPPDMNRFRHISQIPLAIASSVLVLIAAGLYLVYRYSGGDALFGLMCLWSLFILAALATFLAFVALHAPWLHVRVRERSGHRIAVSLPVPMPLLTLGMRIARGHVDDATLPHLDTAEAFLGAMSREGKASEPLMIDVDEDGEHVQVFIG